MSFNEKIREAVHYIRVNEGLYPEAVVLAYLTHVYEVVQEFYDTRH